MAECYIAGKWIKKDDNFAVRNPFDRSVIAEFPLCSDDDIEKAFSSAQNGYRKMKSMSALERSEILARTSRLLKEDAERIARDIALESGKTLQEARAETARCIQTFRIAAEEAKRIGGELIPFNSAPNARSKFGFYLRVPMGVIVAITPFNFPLNLVAHKVAPALAAGNSVILKPSSETPISAANLVKKMLAAGLPAEAIQLITGKGSTVGIKLVRDSRARMITFTGSRLVGTTICNNAGLKKTAMELGSNSACVIMNDADLDKAVERCKIGAFALAGQVCISIQRIFVQDEVFDLFVKKLVTATERIRIGNQMDERTDMGPMITVSAAEKAQQWLEEARQAGGKIVTGGGRKGNMFEPTLITGVSRKTRLFQEEVFAPIALINRFTSFDEAVEMVNDSEYGLQCGIYTNDLNTALAAAHRFEVGGVMINEIPTFRADLMPYGGVKGSGLGREGPKFAIEEMTEIRTVGIEL